jgi:hypothetical protein
MMVLPEKVNARWMASLDNWQLLQAEALLRTEFSKQETAEKWRMGARYAMIRGPESLVRAWLRWLLVNNETYVRGLAPHGPRSASVVLH